MANPVVLKGMELGAVVGTVLIAPTLWLVRGRKLGRSLTFYLQREPMTSLAFFTPATLVAGHYRLKVSLALVHARCMTSRVGSAARGNRGPRRADHEKHGPANV